MKHYNKVLSLHKEKKIIRVQSGATWEDIQNYLNPYHLAVSVMQSSNIFTVGGSLSANVHGRDPHYGPLIETVESFRLLTANGEILNVSRTENSELFRLVIGGFGLFGVILDVDLKVTDNLVYQVKTTPIHYQQFSRYFQKQVLSQPVDLVNGRLSVAPDNFLKEIYMTTYHKTNKHPSGDILPLQQEQNVGRNKFLIGLARDYDWGKAFFWNMQKEFSPNNQLISIIRTT
jgi:decaprenylphospho-beta-D-ribofuranose 2-oxidase